MKKIIKLSLVSFMLLTFSGCGDNAYNGKTGLIGGVTSTVDGTTESSVDSSVKSLYSLIKENSTTAYINALEMRQAIYDLTQTTDEANLLKAQEQFKKLALSYKRVETLYVASLNDATMKDIADFYIEQFIKQSKNYDVVGSLDSVFSTNKAIVTNDLKGLTALEYTLFGNAETLSSLESKMNPKRLSSALLMAENLIKRFKSVDEYYKTDTTFLSSSDDAISDILNVLVQESFNLREWRIGEPAGFTLKYKDDPSTSRLEYHKSLNSLESIKEILNTHKSVMSGGLKTIATLGNASSEADAIISSIDEALAICNSYDGTLVDKLSSPKTQELYDVTRVLQNNYTALIAGLNFRQALLDADGD